MDSFNQRKKDILEKRDKSDKGSWDSRIAGLCDKINSLENYYTTSSCSGRVVVLKDQDIKEKGMFIFVSHEEVDFWEFIEKVSPSPSPQVMKSPAHPDGGYVNSKKEFFRGNFKFKQDPAILHVACRDLDSAKALLEKGIFAGWKRSGIISLGKNIIVELNATEKLEFPLIEEGNLLVGEDFLKKVIEKANLNLKRCWDKIEGLEDVFF